MFIRQEESLYLTVQGSDIKGYKNYSNVITRQYNSVLLLIADDCQQQWLMDDNKQNKNGHDKQHKARRQEIDLEFKEIWDRVQVSICHHLKKNPEYCK